MVAVDAAATKAGKTSTDDYIGEWREESRPCDGDLQREVDDEIVRLVETYPPDLIKTHVATGASPAKRALANLHEVGSFTRINHPPDVVIIRRACRHKLLHGAQGKQSLAT